MTVCGMSLIFGNIKDYSKRILWLPELMLKLIFMWPEKNTIQLTSTFIFWGFLNMFVLWGQITYSYMNYKDYNKSLTVVSSMSTLFQSTLKMLMLTYHAAPLREILSNISTKFWPCRILPDHLEEYKSSYRNGLGAMLSLTCSGMFFSVASLVVPLLSANRELPFRSLYPFDCSVSPIYEMIYILHCFINAYLVNWAVLGFDFLFMGICRNIVSQYTLLQKAFLQLGTEKEKYLNKKLRSLNIDLIVNGNLQANGNSTLLVKLIQLHQLLLKTTKNVENVFNLMAACQLCSSIVAICVSGFISTRENVSKVQVITMTSYLVGHLIQLYLYCATGNELLYVSNNLTQQIFASNWYEIEDVNVQKDIIFVIKNAQIPAKITAFKVFTLNYATYIKTSKIWIKGVQLK
ncbi:odorant receptor Or1-like isoform X2 [Diabrotica undecimpunctata]|uniref:odorant receptor Or1-like isoform X2 n=1 Tax=Diabrotica undecimpunctata TaxID=50387 RepID=UPI003B63C882